MKLTKRSVERLAAPDASGRQQLYWDTEMRGFGLLVSGKSNARTYVVQRKLPGGNTRRVTVGAANVLDLDEARQQARLLLAEFYSGVAPKAKRRAEARRGRTLRDACEDYLRGNYPALRALAPAVQGRRPPLPLGVARPPAAGPDARHGREATPPDRRGDS
jgi:hypothetical protein